MSRDISKKYNYTNLISSYIQDDGSQEELRPVDGRDEGLA